MPGGGDGPRLEHQELLALVESPFGVLGPAVVLLDRAADFGEPLYLTVAQHAMGAFVGIELAGHGAAVRKLLDREFLDRDVPATQLERLLVDYISVGRDAAADDRLTEAERALDHERVGRSARWVDREHHSGSGRTDLALDDHGDVHLGLRQPLVGAVVDRPGAEERAPAALDGHDDRIGAARVQVGLVHAGERGGLGVLCGRGGAHSDGRIGIAARRARRRPIGSPHRCLPAAARQQSEPGRHARPVRARPDRRRRPTRALR